MVGPGRGRAARSPGARSLRHGPSAHRGALRRQHADVSSRDRPRSSRRRHAHGRPRGRRGIGLLASCPGRVGRDSGSVDVAAPSSVRSDLRERPPPVRSGGRPRGRYAPAPTRRRRSARGKARSDGPRVPADATSRTSTDPARSVTRRSRPHRSCRCAASVRGRRSTSDRVVGRAIGERIDDGEARGSSAMAKGRCRAVAAPRSCPDWRSRAAIVRHPCPPRARPGSTTLIQPRAARGRSRTSP